MISTELIGVGALVVFFGGILIGATLEWALSNRRNKKPALSVLAHCGFFVQNPVKYGNDQVGEKLLPDGRIWFCKITNTSNMIVWVTHVACCDDSNASDPNALGVMMPVGRPLPYCLSPGQQIEYWIEASKAPVNFGAKSFLIVDSIQRRYRSSLNVEVPSFGTVAR